VVAKRVWTTDCSSAKSSTIVSSAAAATGESGTAVIATVAVRPLSPSSTMVSSAAAATGESGTAVIATVAVRPLSPSSVRSTSVVVPEREMATTRPYLRCGDSPEAIAASVVPRFLSSRSAA